MKQASLNALRRLLEAMDDHLVPRDTSGDDVTERYGAVGVSTRIQQLQEALEQDYGPEVHHEAPKANTQSQ